MATRIGDSTLTSASWEDSISSGRHLTVVDRFEEMAAAHPDAPAADVTSGAGSHGLSYRELNQEANRLAGALIEEVGDGQARVGLVLDSFTDSLVAMLGALKAGMTYVPLDPRNPAIWLTEVFQHAAVSAVVSRGQAAEVGKRWPVLDISQLSSAQDENPDVPLDATSLACIMYTSGSTGRPKGVMHSHDYVVSMIRELSEFYAITSSDRLSQLLESSFAASMIHTWAALLNGATLCSYDLPGLGFHHLGEWLYQERISGLQMVPTLFRRFLSSSDPSAEFSSVRYIVLGAERTLVGDVDLYRRHFTESCVLIHRLAATEVGMIARLLVDSTTRIEGSIVPAGFPISGRELRIEDEEGAALPSGEVGEIVVKGGPFTDGYWREPELTSAVYGRDLDGRETFRTGDLGRISSNGMLEHIGRKDARVKVRGYGVDLIEVEKALLEHPRVTEAIVIPSEEEAGQVDLIAYLVPEAMPGPSSAEVRGFLRGLLPAYAIPTACVVLEEMPLTARGKIDRRALPKPTTEVRTVTPPSNQLEEALVRIWENVLGISPIGIKDDFFDLGGSSIQAYQIIADIDKHLDVDLPPVTLLRAPDIERMARLMTRGELRPSELLVPFRRGGSKNPWFCVHGRGGGIMFLRDLSPYLDEDRAVIGIQAEWKEGELAPDRTVEELGSMYADEVRNLQPTGPYFLGGSCFGGLVAREMGRNLDEAGEMVAVVVVIDPPSPGMKDVPVTGRMRNPNSLLRRVWDSASYRTRKVLFRRKTRRLQQFHNRRRAEMGHGRFEHLRKIYTTARGAYKPTPSSVPLVVLAERGSTGRHERMWAPVSVGGVTITEFSSNHAQMYLPENVSEVAQLLQDVLDAAQLRTDAVS